MGKRPMCTLALISIVLILAYTSADVRNGTFLASADIALEQGKQVWVLGNVIKKEIKKDYLAVTLRTEQINNSKNQKYKILVYIQNNDSCQIGDKIKLYGKIKEMQISTNKGMFNSALYYKTKGIQYMLQAEDIQILERKKIDIREMIFNLRMYLYEKLFQMFDEDTASLLGGILLGVKEDILEETKELYQRAGIFHLISISGVCTLSLVSLRPP